LVLHDCWCSVTATSSIADLKVADLVAAIRGDRVSPGAGAAAAVALALAAACAGKAVSISLKHTPGDAALRGSMECLAELGRRALAGADEDAAAFTQFLHARNSSVAEKLIHTDEALANLTGVLVALIEDARPRIHASVAGDLLAAEVLAESARRIHERNIADTRSAAAT
jgi:formiminotetrahydrofolate cyclodeaminase